MTKTPIPLHVDDLSIFTRALSRQLGESSPSHLTLMNMSARAAGFQNVQHMRSVSAAAKRLEQRADHNTESVAADARSVERALHQFDASGRLLRWPSKRAVQTLTLWALWAVLPAKTPLSEQDVTKLFAEEHLFEDPATLRRTMISCGLLSRRTDGTQYRRIEQEPPAEAKAVISKLSARRHTRSDTKTEIQHV